MKIFGGKYFVNKIREKTMKKKTNWITVSMVMLLVLFLSGCVTNTASPNIPRWAQDSTGLNNLEFTVLGNITLEEKWHGVLGISLLSFFGIYIPNFDNGTYLFQRGGITYADFLAYAQQKYRDADAVINITVEQKKSDYAFLVYSQRAYIMTGIAIKYNRGTPEINTITTVAENYTVGSINGLVQVQRYSGDTWSDVKAGDILSRDFRIRTATDSSMILSDNTMTITIPGGVEGRIINLVGMLLR